MLKHLGNVYLCAQLLHSSPKHNPHPPSSPHLSQVLSSLVHYPAYPPLAVSHAPWAHAEIIGDVWWPPQINPLLGLRLFLATGFLGSGLVTSYSCISPVWLGASSTSQIHTHTGLICAGSIMNMNNPPAPQSWGSIIIWPLPLRPLEVTQLWFFAVSCGDIIFTRNHFRKEKFAVGS